MGNTQQTVSLPQNDNDGFTRQHGLEDAKQMYELKQDQNLPNLPPTVSTSMTYILY
mgnify:CR=1 FL=1